MSNKVKNVSTLFSYTSLNKTPLFLKFNNSNNYFFLTNNSLLINNYQLFFYFFNEINQLKQNNYDQLIKKNKYFFLKFILKYRKYISLNLILNKIKFKFNVFFKFLFFVKSMLNKKKSYTINNNFFYYYNFKLNFTYSKYFYKNWKKLIGSLISPYNIVLFSKKNWIKKNRNFNFLTNKFFNKNKLKKNTFFLKKKHIINNFFYINKSLNFKNYSNMRFFIKNNINYKLTRKNNYNYFLSRPYIFLNNSKNTRFFKRYPNFLLINLYKKYSRFFKSIRRINNYYRTRFNTSYIFRNFFSIKKILSKSYRNKFLLNSKPLFNWFSFFNLNNKKYFHSKKKMQRKPFFYLWYLSLYTKTRSLKKNKFYRVDKFILNKNSEFTKFSRKIKKGNLFFKSLKLIKKSFLTFFLKIKWSLDFFFLFFKYSFSFKLITFSLFNNFYFYIWKNVISGFFKSKKFLFNFKNPFKFKSLLIRKLKKPFFISRTRNNFILSSYGFIFINNFYKLSNTNSSYFYNFKKIMYSFPYKNEIQRFILRKYSKINFSINFNNIQSNKFIFNNSFFYSKKFSTYSFLFDFFFDKRNDINNLLLQNISDKKNWPYFSNQITSAFNSEKEQFNLNIKRIKFKPGYMTIWRNVRSMLQTSLTLKIKYQYKLTNYLSKYKKFTKFKTFLFMEMRLYNILIKSRFFNDFSLINIFLKNNLIYLNGLICSNPNLQIFSGDFIQLVLNLKYYILYRWFSNLSLKKKNKLKSILKKKNNNFNYSDEKKKSYSFPNSIIYSKNIIDDVPNFLEVDYLTLSLFVLYEPFNWNDLNTYNLIDQRFSIINLYNWKYIT